MSLVIHQSLMISPLSEMNVPIYKTKTNKFRIRYRQTYLKLIDIPFTFCFRPDTNNIYAIYSILQWQLFDVVRYIVYILHIICI